MRSWPTQISRYNGETKIAKEAELLNVDHSYQNPADLLSSKLTTIRPGTGLE